MVVDNYGNLIEEPFHENKWVIEWNWSTNDWDDPEGWTLRSSYSKPIDLYKAMQDVRRHADYYGFRIRPARREYRKLKTGFHVKDLPTALDKGWHKKKDRFWRIRLVENKITNNK